jgi:hypothetical protein
MVVPEPTAPECRVAPPKVAPNSLLTGVSENSYNVGPEGGTFDLTDKPSVSVLIPPCSLEELVVFTYLMRTDNPAGGDTRGASKFISFEMGPARLGGAGVGFVDLHGTATLTWHDSPSPETAKMWAHGATGFYNIPTTVEGSDVSGTSPLRFDLGFALGQE